MVSRSNKVLEEIVIKGLQLFLKGDCFGAVILMKNQGVPNSVIARVLYEQNQIRRFDSSLIQQAKKN